MSEIKNMSSAQNLSAFTYWQTTSEHPPPENSIQSYANSTFLQDSSKAKFFRHPMFFLNNITKQELSPADYERTFPPEMQHRHFLAPLTAPDFSQTTEPPQKPPENNTTEEERKQPVVAPKTQTTKESSSGKVRPYVCDDCGKSFLLKHHLTTHARTHTGIRPHICTHCGKSFTHKHCLNTHLLLHSSDRPYQCEECKKSFTLKHHLLTHARVHSREKPFVCTECGQAFPLKRHLITHNKFHAGERPFICEECGESFAQKDHLVMHSRFHGFSNSFVCSDCGATFSRKFELVNHNKLHGKEPYSCPLCNKEFLQKRTLAAHIRFHSTQSPFVCPQCGETFPSSQELMVHAKTHANTTNTHTPSHKSLVCQECGCVFNSVEALALHIKLHTGDASLVTDLCTLTTSLQQSNFAAAMNNHNTNIAAAAAPVKQKHHICDHCSKGFSAKHGLHQHYKKHPNGTCALRTHVCEVCSKAFFQKNHLLLHQRQHMDPNDKNSPQSIRQQNQLNRSESNSHSSNSLPPSTSTDMNMPSSSYKPMDKPHGVNTNDKANEVPKVESRYQQTENVLTENFTHHQYQQYAERHCLNTDLQNGHLRPDGKVDIKGDYRNGETAKGDNKVPCGVICSQVSVRKE